MEFSLKDGAQPCMIWIIWNLPKVSSEVQVYFLTKTLDNEAPPPHQKWKTRLKSKMLSLEELWFCNKILVPSPSKIGLSVVFKVAINLRVQSLALDKPTYNFLLSIVRHGMLGVGLLLGLELLQKFFVEVVGGELLVVKRHFEVPLWSKKKTWTKTCSLDKAEQK